MAETYSLPPKLDLSAASSLAADLKNRLGGDLDLDASAVTQIGALCVQVIASAALSLRETGHSLRLTGASEKLCDQLANLGFTPDSLTEVGT